MKLTAAILIAASIVLLPGCFGGDDAIMDPKVPDQCMRSQLFKECLQMVPEGPKSTGKYNDWDEVVEACESAAYYQSLRRESTIKPECRP